MTPDDVLDFLKNALQKARDLDFYPLVRPLLFALDPEKAHEVALTALQYGLVPKSKKPDDAILKINVCGIDFSNPLGAAPGLDKQGTAIDGFMSLGFSHVEVGTVTLRPQPGNPTPRLFRVKNANGLINRFGWNSDGADVCSRRLAAWRDSRSKGILGINIGFNKDSQDPLGEYVQCLTKMYPSVDYAVVSVSTPNSPGVRDLQRREPLTELLSRAMEARNKYAPQKPLLLKISPDVPEDVQEEIADVVLNSGIHGLIVGNTTLSRPDVVPPDLAKEAGGFSGPVMMPMTTKLLGNMYRLTQRKIPLIANCGVFTGEDAHAKIRAGASLVQIYTSLVYEGPAVVSRIKRELAALLKRDGFASVADAVGVDNK